MKVISLGWGVQSFTLAAMSALGELEPVDFAIHADTTHEASWTYDFAKQWGPWLKAHGLTVVTVKSPDARVVIGWHGGGSIPAYTPTDKGVGQIYRQCTGHWKIEPIRRWLQANRNKQSVEQWIGISLDEFQRMRVSDVKYITNRYPLIEHKMTRNDCVNWLKGHGLGIPNKSACTFCPFRSAAEWRHIKTVPNDWAEAVSVDNEIRKACHPGDLFLHRSCKPLEDVDLRTDEEKGQMSLWDNECSGVCGV